ncbi:MAG: hypothetical protein IKR57_01165 [Bacilli bacterium]|nr:hypothetical protein [Bacilli bacterium]
MKEKKIKILNKEYAKKMLSLRDQTNLPLTDFECECYSNCFYTIYELTGKQFSFEQIFDVYDFFTDVLDGKKPEIDMFSYKDAFKGFYRLSKRYSTTKNLTEEERIYLCFSIYTAHCILVFDEKTNSTKWNMECFENGPEYIKKEYEYEKTIKNELNLKKYSDPSKDNYGLSEDNPIEVSAVAIEYQYMRALVTEKDEEIEYERIGSTTGKDDIIIDMYWVYVKGKKDKNKPLATLYIHPYGIENTEYTPKGFKFYK